MPQFLTRAQIYRIIQRELPPGDVYPDSGDPKKFFSTSDSDATAAVLADYYLQQMSTYKNQFPVTCDERLSDFEVTYFGYNLPSTLTADQRLAQLLAKIRSRTAPTPWTILTLIAGMVPAGTFVSIAPYNDQGLAANWKLGVSELGVSTFLGYNKNNTAEQNLNAFGYEVRIFGITLSDSATQALHLALLAAEPARSFHVIKQGLNLNTYGLFHSVANVSETDLIYTVAVDPSSSLTGYTGRVSSPIEQTLDTESGDTLTTESGDHLVTEF